MLPQSSQVENTVQAALLTLILAEAWLLWYYCPEVDDSCYSVACGCAMGMSVGCFSARRCFASKCSWIQTLC